VWGRRASSPNDGDLGVVSYQSASGERDVTADIANCKPDFCTVQTIRAALVVKRCTIVELCTSTGRFAPEADVP
jgi:hypothetical protein